MATSIEIWRAAKDGKTSGDGWSITEATRFALSKMRTLRMGEEVLFQATYFGPRFRLVDVGGGLHELQKVDPPNPDAQATTG
jgi:hypothetical protein